MGASPTEIDREITETRAHLDENLDVIERRVARSARRVGLMVAAGLVTGLAVAGVAVLVYRRVRKPSLGDRLQDMVPDGLAGLPARVRSRIGRGPIKVVITQGDEDAGPGTWKEIGRKVVPAIVSTAAGTVVSRLFAHNRAPTYAEE
jgi:hypothetical protein